MKKTLSLLIASYLEPHYVDKIKAISTDIEVIYRPELIASPRYPADHIGKPFTRTPDQELEWQSYLKRTDILFDFDRTHFDDLPELAPNLKWLQTTSSGIGQTLRKYRYAERIPNLVVTNAKGIHARPLAEFCLLGMLSFNKKLLEMQSLQKKSEWKRISGTNLQDKTLVIVGLGQVGQEIARMAKFFGMQVVGIKNQVANIEPSSLHVDTLLQPNQLNRILPSAEFLILIAPHTAETEKMIGEEQLNLLPKGAVLINIARGALVDEVALQKALERRHLGGAVLDVFREEPLPSDSPFWKMDNVIISHHSGSTVDTENALITDIFCKNIVNFLENKPMVNFFDLNTNA